MSKKYKVVHSCMNVYCKFLRGYFLICFTSLNQFLVNIAGTEVADSFLHLIGSAYIQKKNLVSLPGHFRAKLPLFP